MNDREEGWYWVIQSEGSSWECALYEGGHFQLIHWGPCYENELLEIGDMVSRETKGAVKEVHVHEWIDTGLYSYCKCGCLLVKDGLFTKEEIEAIREESKKPCNNVFLVGSVKDEG